MQINVFSEVGFILFIYLLVGLWCCLWLAFGNALKITSYTSLKMLGFHEDANNALCTTVVGNAAKCTHVPGQINMALLKVTG